jgi:hypothetical protein
MYLKKQCSSQSCDDGTMRLFRLTGCLGGKAMNPKCHIVYGGCSGTFFSMQLELHEEIIGYDHGLWNHPGIVDNEHIDEHHTSKLHCL